MIKKLLCKINYHSWIHDTNFYPSIEAKIVTRFSIIRQCSWCGKKEVLIDYHYDPETGEPLYK